MCNQQRFVIDVLATVPWDLLFDVRGSTAGKLPKMTRAFRAFRLLRVLKLGKLLTKAKRQFPFLEDFAIIGTAFQYLVSIMMISHYFACVIRFIGDVGYDNAAAIYYKHNGYTIGIDDCMLSGTYWAG